MVAFLILSALNLMPYTNVPWISKTTVRFIVRILLQPLLAVVKLKCIVSLEFLGSTIRNLVLLYAGKHTG